MGLLDPACPASFADDFAGGEIKQTKNRYSLQLADAHTHTHDIQQSAFLKSNSGQHAVRNKKCDHIYGDGWWSWNGGVNGYRQKLTPGVGSQTFYLPYAIDIVLNRFIRPDDSNTARTYCTIR